MSEEIERHYRLLLSLAYQAYITLQGEKDAGFSEVEIAESRGRYRGHVISAAVHQLATQHHDGAPLKDIMRCEQEITRKIEAWFAGLLIGPVPTDGIEMITCPKCKRTSPNPNDIRERYCGHCHQFHEFMNLKEKTS